MKSKSAFRLVRNGSPAACILAAALATLLGARCASAANIYWDGTGSGWDAVASWDTAVDGTGGDPALIPGAADVANFSITTVNSPQAVNLNGEQAAQGLVFLGTNTTATNLLGGDTDHTLTLGTSGITVNSLAGPVTIGSAVSGQNVAITLGGAQVWTNNSANPLTTQDGVNNGANLLTVTGTGNIVVNGVLGNGAGGLTKTGSGVLTLNNANTYGGITTVSQGALSISNFDSLGTTASGTTVAGSGAALQLSGTGITYDTEALTLNGSGLSTGGALQNLAANNTWAGAITLNSAATIGSASDTLSLTGGINGAFGLTFAGAGNIKVSTTALNANVPQITKLGSGALTFDVNSSLVTAPISVNGGSFTLSGAAILGNVVSTIAFSAVNAGRIDGNTLTSGTLPAGFQVGSFVLGQAVEFINSTSVYTSGNPVGFAAGTVNYTSGVQALKGASLVLDNSGNNLNNRFGGRAVELGGGSLTLIPSNLPTGTGTVTENLAGLVLMQGQSVVTLTADTLTDATPTTANQTNVTAAILNQRGTTTETALIRGTNLGSAAGNGVATLSFTTAPTFIGITGTGGTATTQGMLPYVIVDTTATGYGTRFATTSGAAQILRPLAAGEMSAASAYTAASNVLLSGAQPSISANTTINSLTIDSGNVTITTPSFPTLPATLTISSGGLLSTTAASTISGGILALGNQMDIFTPGANAAANVLTISSRLSGAGLVKAGAGTLVLSSASQAFPGYSANAITAVGNHAGSVYLNEGVVKLGANNAIGNMANSASGTNDANSLTLNPGATLDLNGKSQFVGALLSQFFGDNLIGYLPGVSGGTITSTGGAGSIMVTPGNPGGGAGYFVFGGTITGNVGFATEPGSNWYQVLQGASDYTGPTLVNSGQLKLQDYATMSGTSRIDINATSTLNLDNTNLANVNGRLNASGSVYFNGGTLVFNGRAQTLSTEAAGALVADKGNSTLTVNAGGTGNNSADLTLSSLSRTSGATLNLTGNATLGQPGSSGNVRILVTSPLSGNVTPIGAANNQIIPGVVIGGDLAAFNASTGLGAVGQTNFPAYATGALATAAITANFSGSGAVGSGGQTINALKASGAITFANAGDVLTLTSGMIASAGQSFGTTAIPGILTSSTAELILQANGGNPTLNSVVSGTNKLVLAGGGTYTLTAANLHTGGTTVDGGTLALTNNSLTTPLVVSVPNATAPADGLVLSNATATLTNSPNQIGSANVVTLTGNSTLNLFGNNTLAGLIFNNIATSAPTVNTTPSAFATNTNSTDIALTLSGGITSTSNNIGSVAALKGRVILPASPTLSVGAATFNGLAINPWSADLDLYGAAGGGGTSTKSDGGVLELMAATTLGGTLNVTAGGLQIGTAGAGARFADVALASSAWLNLKGLAGTFGSLSGTGRVVNSGSAATLTVGFDNTSPIFGGSFQRFNDGTVNLISLTTIGTGTMTLTGNTSTASGVLTLNSTSGGGVTFKDAGINNFVQSAVVVSTGSTLTLDDTGSANLSGRLANTAVTLAGGAFTSSAASAGSTESTTGALTFNSGESTVTISQGATSNVTTFGSLGTQGVGSTFTFAGTSLGTASDALFLTGQTNGTVYVRGAVGNDFAVYDTTLGVRAYTGYTTGTNINAVVSANNFKVDGSTSTTNLNAVRTANSLDIAAASVTVGTNGSLLPTQGLTLTNGAVLVNAAAAAISTPVLTLSTEGIFRLNGSNTLNINSRITGTAGLTKTGTGTLTLSKLQEYTGTTTVNQGTLKLGTSVGTNALLATVTTTAPTAATLQLNGGTLDVNGNKLLVGAISSTSNYTGGTLTNSAGGSPVTLTSLTGGGTFGGTITGNLNLTLNGNAVYSGAETIWKNAQSYSGATVIRSGRLTLQDSAALYSGVGDLTNASVTLNDAMLVFDNSNLSTTAAGPTRLPSTVPITLNNGYLAIKPGASADTTTSLGTVTIGGYLNNISTNLTINQTGIALANTLGGTNTLTINNLTTAGTGGVVNLGVYSNASGALTNSQAQRLFITQVGGNTVTSGSGWSTGATGMLPAWITLGNGVGGSGSANKSGFENFATLSSTGFGIVTYGDTTLGAPAYSGSLASGNVTSIGATTLPAGNALTGALKLTGNLAFTGATDLLNIESGGLTAGGVAISANIGSAANNGQLTAGGSASSGTVDLYVYNSGTLNSTVVDNPNGAKVRLIIANINNATTLTGNNTYSGGTIFMDGREGQFGVILGGSGTIIPAGGLTIVSDLSGGAKGLTETAAGQIAAANDVSLAGSNVFLTMSGTNTLASLIFDDQGNTGTPTVNTATSLTLSKTTAQGSAITATNNNITGGVPTVAGTLLTLQDGATLTTSGAAPVDLNISAPLTTTAATAPLHKAGSGSVIFGTAANTFANGVNLDAGSIIFTANSTGTGGSAPASSQIGTGPLTLADGTAIMSDNNRSIGNVVNVANNASFTFGTLDATNARANATNNLTLTNTVTLGAGTHSITVNGLSMTGTISGQVTGGTNLTKAGPGTLVLNNATNNFGGSVTINGGTLQQNVAGSIPSGQVMNVAADAAFNMNAISQSVDSLNGAGSVINPGGAATLTINGTTNGSFSGVLAATTAANLSLVKDGPNTQTLSGTNPYGGSTTVTAGTLLINGANTGAGTVTVGASGTLGGTGSIAGAVNVSGILSPGASIGTLTSGALTFAINSTYQYQVNSSVAPSVGADLQIVNGALNLNSPVTLLLTDIGAGTIAGGTVFSLFNYSGAWNSGTFTYLSNPLPEDSTFSFAGKTWTIDYDATTKGANVAAAQSGSYVNITAAGADAFTTWIQTPAFAIPAGMQGPNDDPDGDGATNLEEFAFGGIPNDGTKTGLVFGLNADSNDVGSAKEMILTIAVRSGVTFSTAGSPAVSDATVDGLNYAIQGSTDLTNWTAVVTPVPLINPGLPSLPAGYQYVSFSLNGSDGLPGKGFLRAQVVRP